MACDGVVMGLLHDFAVGLLRAHFTFCRTAAEVVQPLSNTVAERAVARKVNRFTIDARIDHLVSTVTEINLKPVVASRYVSRSVFLASAEAQKQRAIDHAALPVQTALYKDKQIIASQPVLSRWKRIV